MRIFNWIAIGYFATIVSLFFYSFTQVDLGLTLTRWPLWQEQIQRFFQHIGYFQRPLSTILYSLILVVLFIFYLLLLRVCAKKKIDRKQVWLLIVSTTLILTFSYNAFSYDLFNYVFDAKIITYYHQNPYEHKALDYTSDPMLSFMHWTHRTYPYGPFWLLITVPLSFLGSGIFLITLILFKILMSASYLGTAFFIEKIAQKISPKESLGSLIFFALNPLIIIESLVSSHHDIAMMFFAVFAIYLFLVQKKAVSILLFLLSIGIKFSTALLLPMFFFKTKKMFEISFVLMIVAVVFASWRTELQPWYFVWVLPFAALSQNKFIRNFSLVFSLGLLFHYMPFLYTGNWNPPIPTIKNWITGISALLGIVSGLLL